MVLQLSQRKRKAKTQRKQRYLAAKQTLHLELAQKGNLHLAENGSDSIESSGSNHTSSKKSTTFRPIDEIELIHQCAVTRKDCDTQDQNSETADSCKFEACVTQKQNGSIHPISFSDSLKRPLLIESLQRGQSQSGLNDGTSHRQHTSRQSRVLNLAKNGSDSIESSGSNHASSKKSTTFRPIDEIELIHQCAVTRKDCDTQDQNIETADSCKLEACVTQKQNGSIHPISFSDSLKRPLLIESFQRGQSQSGLNDGTSHRQHTSRQSRVLNLAENGSDSIESSGSNHASSKKSTTFRPIDEIELIHQCAVTRKDCDTQDQNSETADSCKLEACVTQKQNGSIHPISFSDSLKRPLLIESLQRGQSQSGLNDGTSHRQHTSRQSRVLNLAENGSDSIESSGSNHASSKKSTTFQPIDEIARTSAGMLIHIGCDGQDKNNESTDSCKFETCDPHKQNFSDYRSSDPNYLEQLNGIDKSAPDGKLTCDSNSINDANPVLTHHGSKLEDSCEYERNETEKCHGSKPQFLVQHAALEFAQDSTVLKEKDYSNLEFFHLKSKQMPGEANFTEAGRLINKGRRDDFTKNDSIPSKSLIKPALKPRLKKGKRMVQLKTRKRQENVSRKKVHKVALNTMSAVKGSNQLKSEVTDKPVSCKRLYPLTSTVDSLSSSTLAKHRSESREPVAKRARIVKGRFAVASTNRKPSTDFTFEPLNGTNGTEANKCRSFSSLRAKNIRKYRKTVGTVSKQNSKNKSKPKEAGKKLSYRKRPKQRNSVKQSSHRKNRFIKRMLRKKSLSKGDGQKRLEENESTNPTFKQLRVFSGRKLRRNVFSLPRNSEPKFVDNLVNFCLGPSPVKRVLAKNLVKWCIVARKKLVWEFRQKHKNIRLTRCKRRLLIAKQCRKWDECYEAVVGPSRHLPSEESYFHETAYKTAAFTDSPLAVEKMGKPLGGQVVNVFKGMQQTKTGLQWTCSSVCQIDRKKSFRAVKKVYTKLSRTVTDNLMVYFLRDMNKCGGVCNKSSKRGHSLGCRTSNKYNGAPLVILQNFMPHYPVLRSLVDDLNKLKSKLHEIDNLDFALQEGDVETLEKVAERAKLAGGEFKVNENEIYADEQAIVDKHFSAFEAFEKEMRELPRNYCFSCEKLLSRKSLVELSRMRCNPDNDRWNEIFQLKQKQGVSVEFVCHFCLKKLRANLLPSIATLNKMDVPEVPSTIQKLTSYERMFIQRAKAFQTVTKMGTVSGRNQPSANLVPKVVGRTFHLPLPMEKTLEKVLKPHQAIMPNQELYFLLRSLPTKQKKIWESLINVTNILEALQWLKKNNRLYAEINLPNTALELLDLLENKEIPDDLNPDDLNPDDLNPDDPDDSDDVDDPGSPVMSCDLPPDCVQSRVPSPNVDDNAAENCDNPPKDPHPVPRNDGMAAMLTQRERDDVCYQNFTIFPVYDRRENKLATEMYQMIKIDAEASLDSRTEKLDALCFPDLYPFGNNCFQEKRQVDLEFFDFVRAKLLSRHPQFRTNIQYLFFLLNQANMRQLSAGIYQVLNVTREKLSAKEFLEKLERGDFEREMASIFSRIRNTEAYWKTPRNQIRCMIEHYGSPTYFTTHSPADYADKELDNYLRDVLGSKAKGKTTSALIAMDPVSVARFMDRRLHALLAFWCSKAEVMGEIEHYVWRREYQGRGTQHFHFLLWVKNSPVIGVSSSEEVKEFIVQHMSCSIPDPKKFPELYRKVMNYQQHRDNSYCLRYKKQKSGKSRLKVCRFSFPRSVGTKVIIRKPDVAIAGRRRLKPNTRLIELPRKKSEEWTNDYNIPTILATEGNNDIQFVAEVTRALGMYITKYQTKAEKSNMDDIFNDISSTRSLCSRLWNIGLRGLANRECGALEAADTLLSIPLWGTDSKTSFKWIDAHMFRSRRLKSKEQINKLDPDDTDLYCPNVIDVHYPNRHEDLENLCLYDYVKDFDIIKAEPKKEDVVYYPYPDYGYLRKRKTPHLINHYHFDPKQMPEKYYYSLLLMFKPWRQIEELKGAFKTYTEAFYTEKVEGAMQYHEKLGKLQADEEEISKLIEKTMKMMDDEEQDEADNIDGDVEKFAECEANNAMQEFREAANDNTEDLPSLISQLNADQLRVFTNVQSVLKSDTPLRKFVSGVGGTGKSFLIRVITLWVRQELKKDVAITAPTGIAAFNINGFTIHRILQLPVEHDKIMKYTQLNDNVVNVLRAEMKNVALLIIDEISMVSSLTLRIIHERLTDIFDSAEKQDGYFGNISILLFGDLLQLPPVPSSGSPPFIPMTQNECVKHFGSASRQNLWRLFTYDELQINMRQKSDESFCNLLSNIRLGFCSEENLKTLMSRRFQFKATTPEGRLTELAEHMLRDEGQPICLLPTNKMCCKLNEEVLKLLESEEIKLVAEDDFSCRSKSESLLKKAEKKLAACEADCARTAGLDTVIIVKEGARVMLKRNIDVSKGYVNGATGKILSIKFDLNKNKLPKSLRLQMKDDILDLEPVESKFELFPGLFVYRKQFPVTIAYGITIHKSQGLSLDACMIDIGNKVFSSGQSYVALSRVKTLNGLQIINIDPKQIVAHAAALEEYCRLRAKVPHLKSSAKEFIRRGQNQTIRDRIWAVGDKLIEIPRNDSTPTPKKSKTLSLAAFENKDKVSCYANASLQCLLSHEPLRSALRRSNRENALKMVANEYSQKKKTLSAMDVRREASNQFAESKQQDASLFLNLLINKNETLQEKIEFTEVYERKCQNCGAVSCTQVTSYVLQLPLIAGEKKITGLLETLSSWTLKEDSECQSCHNGKCLLRNVVQKTNDILIIQLMLKKTVKGGKLKNTENQINALPTSNINVAGNSFKLHSAVFHHENSMGKGNYTAIVRAGKKFMLSQDSVVSECRWPRGSKDAYLLFYIKISNPKSTNLLNNLKQSDDLAKPLKETNRRGAKVPRSKTKATISVRKPKKTSISKDNLRTIPNEAVSVAVKSSNGGKSGVRPLPRFYNHDNVSCYANVTLQCLLSHEPLRAAVTSSAGISALKNLANQFCRTKNPLSAVHVRQEVHARFAETRQQDASEFLNALIHRNAHLQGEVEFYELDIIKCDTCGHETRSSNIASILQLPVRLREDKITSMVDNYSSWSYPEGLRCEKCQYGKKQKCTLIENTGQMLIIQLMLSDWVNGQSVKITDLRLDHLPSTDLSVNGNIFRLHSSIFHHGTQTESGHYTAIVQSENDRFVLANDLQISECHWPEGSKDAYILFYRKV